jgi:uncharacterized membrane protein YeaQ/YmgE (transglycosylase-associated protein family)
MENLLYFLLVGLVAGWLAGQVMKGKGFGLVGNLVVGCLGAVLGGWLFGAYAGGGGLLASIIVALLGAIILLFIISLVKK